MGLLRNIALVILFISLLTFVALFGRLPALRNTPVGWLYRLLCISLPNHIRAADDSLTSGRVTIAFSRATSYLIHDNHPLVLLFFLSLLTSCSATFIFLSWSRLDSSHHFVIPVVLPLPYLFTYLSATSNASHITFANHSQYMVVYPYDYTIFHPAQVCRTCQFVKPARSKHCSICRVCVLKHDHHCAWVNNCLGRDNYRWFLLLLTSLTAVLVYGALLAFGLLWPHMPSSTGWRGSSGLMGIFERWTQTIHNDVLIGAIGTLACFTAPLSLGLLTYHVYLIWAGMTTNETQKWDILRDDMADGRAWKGHRLENKFKSIQWPIQTDQIVVKTNDGNPPSFTAVQQTQLGVVNRFERCWHLGDVNNLYDLGFWDNFVEIFFR